MNKRLLATIFAAAFCLAAAQAQTNNAENQASQHNMASMDMSGHDMSDKKDMSNAAGDDNASAMHSMERRHMDMGPHMKMTALRSPKPGDQERANQVVEAARKAATKYENYQVALNDGFKIFLPDVPQKQYHFTNYGYAFEARFSFNPEHPTSLLYEKHGDDYKLVGVMYTAPKSMTEDELDQRIPISIAQWHEHVNFCAPPPDKKQELFVPQAKFGLRGSIATKDECDLAGGTFRPIIFNWMVHVYPFEKNPADIWAVERGMDHHD